MIKNLYVNKMLFYGKSAIGLGESLNIPATTKDLIENNLEEAGLYFANNQESYKKYCAEYHKGKESLAAQHGFFKNEHKQGRFLADVVTADDLIDRFYGTFPNIHSYLSSCADTAVATLYGRTPDVFGRVRRFAKPETSGDESSIRRAAQNFPIQG